MSDKKSKKFSVVLDGSKCLSYRLNNKIYKAGRINVLPENKLKDFRESGVFLIYPHVANPEKIEAQRPRKKQNNVNPDDKGDVITEKPQESNTDKDGEKPNTDEKSDKGGDDKSQDSKPNDDKGGKPSGKPSGVIGSGALNK